MGWLYAVIVSKHWFKHSTRKRLMAWVARSHLLLEELRFVWTQRAYVVSLILLRLDLEYTIPRCGPLCRDLSLERVLRGFVDFPDTHGMGKPSTHNLTVINRVLHHMLCSIFLPHGGHRDKVSYYEAFLIDSILTGRQIHLGYLVMMHMIACCENTTCVLLYGHFLARVFKDVDVDLSRETNFEASNTW